MHAAVTAVTRNATTWEIADRRDELVAAMAGRLAPKDPVSLAPALVARATQLAASQTSDAVRCQTAARTLAEAVERAGGIPTSALDHARLGQRADATQRGGGGSEHFRRQRLIGL